MTANEARKAIQQLLHVEEDGVMGEHTREAFDYLSRLPDESPWPAESTDPNAAHYVFASSFADPADVAAFRRCKERGNSDMICFGIGDNGVGKWGDSCVEGTGAACALPPEDWQQFGASARGKKVIVTANGKTVECRLLDTMPHKANIHNNAGIDLNPDAVRSLGLEPPILVRATWRWA